MAGVLPLQICAMQAKAGDEYSLWDVFPGAVGSVDILTLKVPVQPLLLAEDAGGYKFLTGGAVLWRGLTYGSLACLH